MKSWLIVVAVVVAAVGLGVLATFVLRDGDPEAPGGGAGAPRSSCAAPSSSPGASDSPMESPDVSTSQAPATPRIVTTWSSYFGEPFETIEIEGRYLGVHTATKLRVQLEGPNGWTLFPLPAVTRPSGEFRAYVELGESGRHRLRIVDPASGRASEVLTVLVF